MAWLSLRDMQYTMKRGYARRNSRECRRSEAAGQSLEMKGTVQRSSTKPGEPAVIRNSNSRRTGSLAKDCFRGLL